MFDSLFYNPYFCDRVLSRLLAQIVRYFFLLQKDWFHLQSFSFQLIILSAFVLLGSDLFSIVFYLLGRFFFLFCEFCFYVGLWKAKLFDCKIIMTSIFLFAIVQSFFFFFFGQTCSFPMQLSRQTHTIFPLDLYILTFLF